MNHALRPGLATPPLSSTARLTIEFAATFRPGGADPRDLAIAIREIRVSSRATGEELGRFNLEGSMPVGLDAICGLSITEAWGAWSEGPRTVLRFDLLRAAPEGLVFEIDHNIPGQLAPGVPAVVCSSSADQARYTFCGGTLRIEAPAPLPPASPGDDAVSPERQALVVVGMHRSGTSAMARALSFAGAALPRDLMPAMADNPSGFWESTGITELNDRILRGLSSQWDDVFAGLRHSLWAQMDQGLVQQARSLLDERFGDAPVIVMKDPRVSVLIPIWDDVLRQAGYAPCYVILLRDPRDVAESLMRRDAFPRSKSYMLWASYMMAIERDTRGVPRCFVQFDDLLTSVETELDRIKEAAGGAFYDGESGQIHDARQFLDPCRVHRAGERDDGGFAWVGAFYDALSARPGDAARLTAATASVERRLTELEGVFGPTLRESRIVRVVG